MFDYWRVKRNSNLPAAEVCEKVPLPVGGIRLYLVPISLHRQSPWIFFDGNNHSIQIDTSNGVSLLDLGRARNVKIIPGGLSQFQKNQSI